MTDIDADARLLPSAPTEPQQRVIQRLNDDFRRSGAGGIVAVTPGVKAFGMDALAAIAAMIRGTDDFPAEIDPYDEHDMGKLTWDGTLLFWKIDYYDVDMRFGSPDPADPTVTTRVMTILLASEY